MGVGEEEEVETRTLRLFSELCLKHNLTHSVGNAFLKFMLNPLIDPRKLPKDMRTLRSRYDKVLKREGNTVELDGRQQEFVVQIGHLPGFKDDAKCVFNYFHVVEAVRALIQGTPDDEVFQLNFQELRCSDSGERVFGPVWSGDAWRRHETFIQNKFNAKCVLVGCILYCDETCINTIRGASYYPIILALGNHSMAYRCTREGKYVIGYLPVLKCSKSVKSKTVRAVFGLEKTKILHSCWAKILGEFAELKRTGAV